MATRDLNITPQSNVAREKRELERENAVSNEHVTKPVVKGKVTTQKKSGGRKFFSNFISEDIASVKDYVLSDVILPAIKDTVADTITNSINLFLYGETRGRSSRSGSRGSSYTNYSGISNNRQQKVVRGRRGLDIDDIILESRGEAEDVLDGLMDVLDNYRIVTVADLYDLIGLQADYTSNKYGWTRLSTARVRPVPQGYLLDLPRPEYIQ